MALLLLMLTGGVLGVQASEQLTLTPGNGTYASGGNYVNSLTFSTVPAVTIAASANNMDRRLTTDYFLWHSGSALSGTYTISVPATHVITSYVLTATANSNNQTVTAAGISKTFTSSEEQELTVSGLSDSYTTFTLSGANTGLKVTKIVLTVEESETGSDVSTYVCTLNNTNTSRGALMYAPSQSTKWVWSSGKNSQTFNKANANCQWVFVKTATADEYYLYNLGAGKFAIPVSGGTYGGYSWAFSGDAVAVKLLQQSDGTYKIKTANSDTYMAVSNGYEGPIINYNDIGGNFTLSKAADLTSSVTAAVEQAMARLVHNTTPLAAKPTGEGWYAIRIKTHATYADQFVFTAAEEINYNGTLYPLDFYSETMIRPAIDDATYYAKLTETAYGHYWQLPNGRFIQNAKPVSGVGESSVTGISYDATNGFTIKSTSYYFVPYLLGDAYFIGETGYAGRAYYDIYPINLNDAGLTAWQVICDDAAESTKITCTRSDVSGLAHVYKNGYVFLPSGVTPASSDFSMPGALSCTVDAAAHTVTMTYDPKLAIVAGGVSVSQGYGTTGLGNDKAVLLRIQADPFNAMENAVMTFSLTNAGNIAGVKVYETGNTVEFNAISSYTKTFEGSISDGMATVALGSVAAGTHYYWLCATVADDATVGDDIDAALTSITYDYNGYSGTECDLTSVGNPAHSMKIFDVQKHLFLPTVDGDYTRIPALITADDGSIIAACDKRYGGAHDLGSHKIDVILRRSTDGGKTWSSVKTIAAGDGSSEAAFGYGDPAFVKGADGKLFCLFAAGSKGFGNGLKHIGMTTSTDNGATWSAVVDITTRSGHWTNNSGYEDFFVTSGKGLYTSDGVMMFLLDVDRSAEKNYVLYSTDEGTSWTVDANVVATGANEAKLVELEPGKLLSSTRAYNARIFNTGTYTKNADGTCTFTWGTQRTAPVLSQNGSGNNQDVIVYNRNDDGTAKVLLHTITSDAGHKNLKLFMSIDNGDTWNQVMQVQPGGSRYAVTTIMANGDLGLLFEDYSLETGREYPINFLTITKAQIEEWYEELYDAEISPEVKVVYGTSGEETFGTWANSKTVWTSNGDSGLAGVTMRKSAGSFDRFSSWNGRYNLAFKVSADNTDNVITLSAPEGYMIKGYSMDVAVNDGTGYSLTAADGTSVEPQDNAFTPFEVSGVNASETSFTILGSSALWLKISNFVLQLCKTYPVVLNVVGEKSYATLYLPFDVQTDADTKAYYASAAADGVVTLADLDGGIAAKTAVVLINEKAATEAVFGMTTRLEQAVSEGDNLLKGTLEPMTLDLGEATPYYSMGRKDGKIGFYKFDNNGTTTITLGANRAYLDTGAAAGQGKGFIFSFGEADGIEQVEREPGETAVLLADAVYNLSGQRVSRLSKGIYIKNGRKVVMK